MSLWSKRVAWSNEVRKVNGVQGIIMEYMELMDYIVNGLNEVN